MAVLIKTDPDVACHLSLQKVEAGGLPVLGQYRLYCKALLETTKQQTQTLGLVCSKPWVQFPVS